MNVSLSAMLAITLVCLSLIGLRYVWRKNISYAKLIKFTAWSGIFLAGNIWAKSAGMEYGYAFSLVVLSLTAWLVVGYGAEIRPIKNSNGGSIVTTLSSDRPSSFGHKLTVFFTAGLLSGLASCLATIAVTGWLPASSTNRMVIAAFLFPITWAVTATWVCSSKKLLRNIIILTTTTLIVLLYLYALS